MQRFPSARTGAILMVLLVGCGSGTGYEDEVVIIEEGDPEMLAAEAQARATVDDFIAALQNPTAEQSMFAVKAKFVEGDDAEFMWVADLEVVDGNFVGTINNEPQMVSHVSLGDPHTVAAIEINDWMYLENGEIVGGFTIAVLESRAGN